MIAVLAIASSKSLNAIGVPILGALFLAAGGYHHHVGLNTWQGEGAPPPPADAVGLRHFAIEFPNQSALDEVIARVDKTGIPANQTDDGLLLHDPSQNGVMLTKKN